VWDKQSRFTALVNALSGDLYRYAYWLCGQRAAAEDLVQETFARAWRSLDQLRDDAAAKGWLFTTLRREHARQFERVQPAFENTNIEDIADYRRDFDDRPEALALRLALARLPQEYREPLVLQVLGGFSGEEIAAMLGVTSNTVMVRLYRARQKLRQQLSGEDSSTEVYQL
jgi:RNA polymerase sigma-70 factor (ECF subfamily)